MRLLHFFLACVPLLVLADALAATSIHRCEIDGKVSFQSTPCPSTQVRKPPNLQELNARQREIDAAAKAARKAEPSTAKPVEYAPIAPRASSPASFSCDGRKHCSQMRSCAEAKFFLANCPGTKMDGDGDGIPCEEQWCR